MSIIFNSISRAAILLFVVMAFFAACEATDSRQSEDDRDSVVRDLREMEREIMEVHDAVMPEMGEVNNAQNKLEAYVADNPNAPAIATVRASIDSLVMADSVMWEWMHNWQRPDYDGDLDSARLYLEEEIERVRSMEEKFLAGLASGQRALKMISSDE